ncbi:hypothetical protein KKC91_09390 [bacterium]|nr:hypothetical protein [bacterium]
METERYVPVNDEIRLKQTGIPYTRATLYRFKCQSRYPGLVIKIGNRVVVDVAKFEELVQEGKKDALKKSEKLQKIREELKQ